MTIDKSSPKLFMGFFIVLLAIVLYLTLTPAPPHIMLDDLPMGDKIEHAMAFGALMLMARLGFPQVRDWLWLEHLSFLGAMIEVVQATPTLQRDCDWHDWLADSAGALLMLVALRVIAHRRRTRPATARPATLH